jgi:hypothetical protein
LSGIFDGLEARRNRLPFIVAEILMAHAGGNDQRVVRHLAPIGENYLSILRVNRLHFTQDHFGIALPLDDRPQRRGNVGRRQGPGRHLIEQGLKQMKVPPIDQRDLHRRPLEPLDDVDAAESASDDNDTMSGWL